MDKADYRWAMDQGKIHDNLYLLTSWLMFALLTDEVCQMLAKKEWSEKKRDERHLS